MTPERHLIFERSKPICGQALTGTVRVVRCREFRLHNYFSCPCTKTFHDTAWDACSGLSWTIIRKSTYTILIQPHRIEKPKIILNYLAACDILKNAVLRYLEPSINTCVIGVCLLNARQSCSPLVTLPQAMLLNCFQSDGETMRLSPADLSARLPVTQVRKTSTVLQAKSNHLWFHYQNTD